VTYKGQVLSKEVIECWPEVFGEVSLKVLPLRYIRTVLITFKDGKIWEIKVTSQIKKDGWDSFVVSLSELIDSYSTNIEIVDFKLDAAKVKKDITKSTNKFLKNRKL
jgi:hypothetical protein